LVEIASRWVYPLSKWTKREVIMYAIAIALFVAIVAIVPNLLEWYPKWITETNTPIIFKRMPYLPMWLLTILAILAFVFFLYASIREYHIQKEKKLKQDSIEMDIKDLKTRIKRLEK
jgi:phosphatidylglycerophosphate synthase